MHQFSLKYLRCVNCHGTLETEILEQSHEIEEGFLVCNNCSNKYPIILKIPILYSHLSSYLSNRAQLGGYLMTRAKNEKIKSIVKNSLKKIKNLNQIETLKKKQGEPKKKKTINSKFIFNIKNNLKNFKNFILN